MQTLDRTPAQRYAPVPADQLEASLRDLDGWRGDTRRLERTVRPQDLWGLLERVAEVEAALDHHAVVELDRGAVTFELWTHVRGGVTTADLELARRLDTVLAEA